MARRGGEADAEAPEVEVDVSRGVEFHFDRSVASGRDFAQLERAAEAAADFGPDLFGIERHAGVAGVENEPFAGRRTDAVVVREAHVARCHPCARSAEEAAAQIERQRIGREGARRADGLGVFGFGGIFGEGQFGASPELLGQQNGIEILDGLTAVAAQNPYFR